MLELLVTVVANVGLGTLWLDNIIALLPHPDGVCLDARELFEVADGIYGQANYFDYQSFG